MNPKKTEQLNTEKAPRALGAYSQAVVAGDYIFVSGQLPIKPATGDISGGNITVQTLQSISNIENILSERGMDLSNVVKTEIFLSSMEDFEEMDSTYASKFTGEVKPARYVVQAARLPKDVLVEIACVAYKG